MCSDPPRNREQPGTAYGSLALKARYFSVREDVRQPCDFNILKQELYIGNEGYECDNGLLVGFDAVDGYRVERVVE